MNIREITIGRSNQCDIYLDPNCRYASGHHATIYYDDNQLMFRDVSSNGTLVNNVRVHHRAVPIHRGDSIMLAGKYQLSWNQIDTYFPPTSVPMRHGGTIVESFPAKEIPASAPDTSKWNWGAFGIYPIWGFFNGCGWAILISLFFGWLYPIPNIIFGFYGSRWSWQNKRWGSAAEFQRVQSNWTIWGILVFCLNLVFVLFWALFALSLIG